MGYTDRHQGSHLEWTGCDDRKEWESGEYAGLVFSTDWPPGAWMFMGAVGEGGKMTNGFNR